MRELHELIERVERLTGPNYEVARLITEVTGYPNIYRRPDGSIPVEATFPNFTASLDAAIALKERLLPDMRTENLCEWDHPVLRERGPWMCDLVERGRDCLSGRKAKCAHAPTPAIALVLATLKALAAREGAE